VNSLAAIPQGTKVRPVLNVSLPQDLSLNSNVREEALEKVYMCSARCFSHSLVECGKGAWMAKIDMRDAYKNIPCKIENLNLQGFTWLNKFFVETRQIFGARTSVSNFDMLGSVVLTLVLIQCRILKKLVHRQLDDVPIVVPFEKNICAKNSQPNTGQPAVTLELNLQMIVPCMTKRFLARSTAKSLEFGLTQTR